MLDYQTTHFSRHIYASSRVPFLARLKILLGLPVEMSFSRRFNLYGKETIREVEKEHNSNVLDVSVCIELNP